MPRLPCCCRAAAAEEDSRRSAVPLLPTPAYETAADGEIRQTILQLADKDATVRQHALDKLVKTRDGRLAAFVRSYFEGSLYLWNGQPVLGEQAASDAKGKRELLLDPLTLQPVLKDGVPAVVHLGELKEVDFPRTERKAVNDAQQALALWSDNYEKRISAIQRAGEHEIVGDLPALEEIAKADPLNKIRHTARESIDLIRLQGRFPGGGGGGPLGGRPRLGLIHSARGRNVLADLLEQTGKTGPPASRRTRRPRRLPGIDRARSIDTKAWWRFSIVLRTGCLARVDPDFDGVGIGDHVRHRWG